MYLYNIYICIHAHCYAEEDEATSEPPHGESS